VTILDIDLMSLDLLRFERYDHYLAFRFLFTLAFIIETFLSQSWTVDLDLENIKWKAKPIPQPA